MDRDAVVGIVGGLVLLVALLGVFFYASTSGPETELGYETSWPVEEGPTTRRSDTLDEGENRTYRLELSSQNLTRVRINLSWEDDTGQPDRFRLTVNGPGPIERRNTSAANGSLELVYRLASVPPVETINASNRSEAIATGVDRYTREEGQGTWRITVTLVDAPGQRPIPDAPQLETQPDGSNSYELAFGYSAYRLEVGDVDAPG